MMNSKLGWSIFIPLGMTILTLVGFGGTRPLRFTRPDTDINGSFRGRFLGIRKQTFFGLAFSGLARSTMCHRYNMGEKDILHCFMNRIKAQAMWYSLGIGRMPSDLDMYFLKWIKCYSCSLECLFSVALWWIWRDRNNDVFNEEDSWSTHRAGFGCILRDSIGTWIKGCSGAISVDTVV
ncbi:hypothetical protein AHAS_Ahas03G0326300 [Arachis hypogaea]